jgi:hypothetical protein
MYHIELTVTESVGLNDRKKLKSKVVANIESKKAVENAFAAFHLILKTCVFHAFRIHAQHGDDVRIG